MPTNADNSTGPLSWVLTPRELENMLEAIMTSSEVVIDLETTGLDEFAYVGGPSNGGVAARVALGSLTLPQDRGDGRWNGEIPTTYILPLSHPDSPFSGTWRAVFRRTLQTIKDSGLPVENQNMKFDSRWGSATTGVDVAAQITWDTQVSSHLLDETRSTKLKERAPETFGIDSWADFDLSYPGAAEQVPLIELGEYAGRDTWWTWRLIQQHREDMFIDGGGYPDPIYDARPETTEDYQNARLGQVAQWVAMPTVASVTIMEQNGFRLDVEWTKARLAEELAKKEAGLDKLAAWYGQDREKATVAATALWFKDLTARAVAADDLRIISTTKNGNPQWNKGVLNRNARAGRELAQVILDTRSGLKLAEYLSAWLSFVRSDGKIHAGYNVGRVSTGRLSSSEPNMQQISKTLRPAFIPSDGYVLGDFDFSQLELRIAAFVSRCQPMLDAFHAGMDLHKMIAARTSGKALEDVTPYERQKGKAQNFGLLYLQQPAGFRDYAEDQYGVSMTIDEAVQAHHAFFDQWAGMREWHEETKRKVRRDGYITSPIGRVRRLPEIWSPVDYLREGAERKAVNTAVQGTGSDLMQVAAADIQGLLPGTQAVKGVRLVASVHDSIVLELPENDWEEPAREIQHRMENAGRWFERLGVKLDVPIVADFGVGTRWGLSDISEPE